MNPTVVRSIAWMITTFAWLDVLFAGRWESDVFCVSHAMECALLAPLALSRIGVQGGSADDSAK